MSRKSFGVCGKCGARIRRFGWALPDWMCERCYFERFPDRDKAAQDKDERAFETLFAHSHIPDEESYEFLKEHLYDKPGLYEPGFQQVRAVVNSLQSFQTLEQMRDFCASQSRDYRLRLRADLTVFALQQKGWELFPRIIEILMFVVWVDIIEDYGTEDRFCEGYKDLIREAAHEFIP